MVFHWSLSDGKSQVSRTLLSILADLNNAVVWMVSTHSLISKSSSPCTNPLVTVPSAPITIGITLTFIFHSFFNSLAKFRFLSLFAFFVLPCGQPERQSSLFGRFSLCWLLLGLVVWPRLDNSFVSQNPRNFCLIFLDGFWVWSNLNFSSQFLVDHPVMSGLILSLSLSALIYCIRLCDWSFRLFHHITYVCYFVISCLFFLWPSHYGVILSCY